MPEMLDGDNDGCDLDDLVLDFTEGMDGVGACKHEGGRTTDVVLKKKRGRGDGTTRRVMG